MEHILSDLYYDVSRPTSFRGIKTLLNNSSSSYDEVKNWLLSQPTYTRHYPVKIKFPRNPIVSRTINHIWFADLVEITNFNQNDGYRYILTVIDNLSKKGYAIPLLNKLSHTIRFAFMDILKYSETKPLILITDQGPEFINKEIRDYFQSNHINHVVFKGRTKPSVVERWNRTLK